MFLARALEREKWSEKHYSFTSPDSKGSIIFLLDLEKKLTGGILKPDHKLSLRSLLRLIALFNERRHDQVPCCKRIEIGDGICAVLDFRRNILHLFECDVDYKDCFSTLLPFCERDMDAVLAKDKDTLNRICTKVRRMVAKNMVEDLCVSLEIDSFLEAFGKFTKSIIMSYDKFEIETVLIAYEAVVKKYGISVESEEMA